MMDIVDELFKEDIAPAACRPRTRRPAIARLDRRLHVARAAGIRSYRVCVCVLYEHASDN